MCRISSDAGPPSADPQLRATNPQLRTDLWMPSEADSNRPLEHIDVPVNGLALLAAIGLSLRRFFVRITPCSPGNSPEAFFHRFVQAGSENARFKQWAVRRPLYQGRRGVGE
jgi:hypothetical protein